MVIVPSQTPYVVQSVVVMKTFKVCEKEYEREKSDSRRVKYKCLIVVFNREFHVKLELQLHSNKLIHNQEEKIVES